MDQSSGDKQRSDNLVPRTLLGVAVGLAAGMLGRRLGIDSTWLVENIIGPFGALFIRLLMMIAVPLVLASSVITIFDLADLRKLGERRLARLYRVLPIAILAIVLGVSLAKFARPVDQADPPPTTDSLALRAVKSIVPNNPVAAIAGEQPSFLHLAFFACMLGLAGTLIREQAAAPVLRGLKALCEISLKILDVVMKLAPIAAAFLVFGELSRRGPGLVERLAWLGVVLLAGLYLTNRSQTKRSAMAEEQEGK